MQLDRIIAVRNNKTVYCDEGKTYKVFGEPFSKADVLREAMNEALAEETGLFVPKVLEVGTINGKWTIVSEYIEGKSILRLIGENPEKKDDYLNLFVDLQLEVFEKKAPLFCDMHEKLERKIFLSDIPKVKKDELLQKLSKMPVQKKLCHGDFNPSNVILTPEKKLCTIDWSHASLGNSLADAAGTALSLFLDGKTDLGNEYIALFLKKSNEEKEDLENWISIVAAALSVSANEREKQFLLGKIKNSNR
ncbi:MAG: phosphotransferase [Clostridia bacterium]|nr:phosphotransferase [Clostridia bacterium]